MKKIIPLLILTGFSSIVFGQTNYEKFKKLFKVNDTVKIKSLLAEWERSNPNDPELYTAASNFYFSTSQKEVVSLERNQKSGESIQLTDSTGKVAGYLNSNLSYDPTRLTKSLSYLNKGIEKFPSRLDIRFGKCFILGEIEDYKSFTSEIIKAIEYSNTIKNNWLWTENKKLDDAENSMLGSVYSYLKQLYETEDDSLLENIKQIGGLAIKYYPANVEILSITAVAHTLTKSYDEAIKYLQMAEKINPKDFIVLNNIAECFKRKGDKENAIKYFQLTEKYGDAQAKEQARRAIKEIKN